jgi:DNA-binding response OmpR family regulator
MEGQTMWKRDKATKRKILVVDDEQDFAKALKVRLRANGYDVVLAFNSIEALTMVHKEKPSLIILDIMVPGGGGFAVAERLKLSSDTRDIPFIILTGMPGDEARAYKAGACSYLMKPYNPDELLSVIKGALELNGKNSTGISKEGMGITPRMEGFS